MPITSVETIEERGSHSAPILPHSFSLGDWQVLPELNRLKALRGDEERQLEPRLMKLLCFLTANEDRVLSRDELVHELWPRVIVNENSLTRAVSELRKQLQSSDSSVPNYIETIPKRGYRLIPAVETTQASLSAPICKESATHSLFALTLPKFSPALAAACVCLILAGWALQGGIGNMQQAEDGVFLSDEILEPERDFLGGELQLSTMEEAPIVEAISTPVISQDEKQYAFIEYDANGSTIYLGGIGTAVEPEPVYFSNQHLFNLAWSPIGNNLLFAMQPAITTAAVFSPMQESAKLVMLDLNTLEASRLIEELHSTESEPNNGLSLT